MGFSESKNNFKFALSRVFFHNLLWHFYVICVWIKLIVKNYHMKSTLCSVLNIFVYRNYKKHALNYRKAYLFLLCKRIAFKFLKNFLMKILQSSVLYSMLYQIINITRKLNHSPEKNRKQASFLCFHTTTSRCFSC